MTKEELIGEFLNKRDFFIKILERDGVIASKNIELYYRYKDIILEKSGAIQKYIDIFKLYYKKATIEERYLLNNFIFILDILNIDAKNGIKEYIKRALLFDLLDNLHNSEIKVFFDFIKHEEFDIKDIIDTIKELIEVDNFLSLSNNHRKSLLQNLMEIFKIVCSSHSDLLFELQDNFISLLDKIEKDGLIEEYLEIYQLIYQIFDYFLNDDEKWDSFNENIAKKASNFFNDWGLKHSLKKFSSKKEQKNILFLVDFESFDLSLISFITTILQYKKAGFKVNLFILNNKNSLKIDMDFLKKVGIKYLSLDTFLETESKYLSYKEIALKLREELIKNNIEYLIATTMNVFANFIFSTRSAKNQIYWSFGNSIDTVLNIDQKVTHLNIKDKEGWITFDRPFLKDISKDYNDEKKKGIIIKDSILKEFGKDKIIIGTIGRINDENRYLKTVAKILEINKNAIYIACNVKNGGKLQDKVASFGIDRKRFFTLEQVDVKIFGSIIDIWPDNFCIKHSGYDLELYLLRAGIVVSLDNSSNSTLKEIQREIDNQLLPKNIEEFIKNVSDLIDNRSKREELKGKITALFSKNRVEFIEKILK